MKILHAITTFALVATLLGCSSSSSTYPVSGDVHADDHEHQLASLTVGVEQLTGFRDQIKSAFESGSPHDCDGALHEAVHVLEALPKAADVAAMTAEDQEIVNATAKELFGLLGKIHDGFHGASDVETNAYEAVAGDIDKALETLRSKIPSDE
jgi:hypothetical protein